MTSLAWSTLALLVLLLPGFSFLIGLYAPERFARDVTPRNPLAALAATVLASLVAHSSLTTMLRLSPGWVVDWAAVLDAVQMAPRAAGDAGTAASRAARHFQRELWAITGYVLSSCLLGYGAGRLCGHLVLRGWFHAIAVQHAWVYPLQPGMGGVMTYAHVLTGIGRDGKLLLYRGRLKHFALAANGNFDYVVLAATGQRFLDLGGDVPTLGGTREIGDDRVPPPLPPSPGEREAWGAWARRWSREPKLSWKQRTERRSEESFRRVAEQRMVDKALMMVPGATIQDIVFQGLHQIPLARPVRRRTRALRESLLRGARDDEAELRALLDFRGARVPLAAAMPTREVQRTLRSLGIDPGPEDGVAGQRTQRAIRQFQGRHGLHPDGEAGPLTSARLRSEAGRQRGVSRVSPR